MREGQPSLPGAGVRPKIAIVIDDLGGENHLSRELLLLDFPLTLSILPFTTYSKPLAIDAPQKGKEVILHLPMEPHGYPKVKPGEGVLLQEMDEERLLRQLCQGYRIYPQYKRREQSHGVAIDGGPRKIENYFFRFKEAGSLFSR